MRLAVCAVWLAFAWSAQTPPRGATLFEGARLIVDARTPPIDDGALFLFAGRGIAAPNAGPGTPELKASAYGVTSEDEARRAVRAEITRKVDVVKIWVDDRNGAVQKLAPPLYRAMIDEAHRAGARVVAHIFYLDDAK